jgi:hypothetical protein
MQINYKFKLPPAALRTGRQEDNNLTTKFMWPKDKHWLVVELAKRLQTSDWVVTIEDLKRLRFEDVTVCRYFS